jgi:arogenate dehydrogenase (NADP+)
VTGDLPSIAVIGFGRFGRLWAGLLAEDLDVVIHDTAPGAQAAAHAHGFSSVPLDVALSRDVIFYSVPISAFETTLRDHVPYLTEHRAAAPVLVDLLSVKVHPRDVFERVLPEGMEAMLAHPLFGPDSVAVSGLRGQTIVVDRYRMSETAFAWWGDYFASKGLVVITMTAEEHDRLAAESQGVTHFVGRTLERFGFVPTPIDTLGTRLLHEITAQVTNDTQQLFEDLQTRNPYTGAMRLRLSQAQDAVVDRLLPNRLVSDRMVVGIQGGRGSFNEDAARHYMGRTPDTSYELVYLHTTEAVLRALQEGTVDRGIFAIHNSVGGMVGESVSAMAAHRFTIVEEFAIRISHCLMTSRGADPSGIDTIMTHPQVLAQCHSTLARRYPLLRQTSGSGDLIDHAKVAELLGDGALPANIATMGSRVLAEIHDLQVIEDNLQDLEENFTAFLWVERPHSGARAAVSPEPVR